jgi:hypothetical protein
MLSANKRRVGAMLCCCAATGVTATTTVSATTLFDSQGFESSAGYTVPSYLYNEPGTPGASGPGIGQFAGTSYANPYAAVYTYTSIFGGNTNASNLDVVNIHDSADTNSTGTINPGYYYPLLNSVTPGNGGVQSQVSVAFQLARGSTNVGDPFFGVVAYGALSSQEALLNPVGELGIDGTTGTIVGANSLTAAGATFVATADTFYDFDLLLDYPSQTYSLYEASTSATSYTLLGTGVFITPNTTTFTTAALATSPLATVGGVTVPVTGDGYFDNFSISTVPEPTTAGIVMGGLAMSSLVRRRRNASTKIRIS